MLLMAAKQQCTAGCSCSKTRRKTLTP